MNLTKNSDLNLDCLNTIRLIAALQVVFGHTTRWLDISVSETFSHVMQLIQGVPVFFVLSGFLIWHSVGRSKSFKDYALKRFWRIFPELWIAVLVELLVFIALYDKPIDWGRLLLFGLQEGSINIYFPAFLKDYGVGGPNGALWTISCLIKFYIIAWFVYKIMRGRPYFLWVAGLLLSILFGFVTQYVPEKYYNIYNLTTLPFLWLFILGLFVADKWSDLKIFFVKYWYVALVVAALSAFTGFDINCSDPACGYGLIRCVSILVWVLGFAYTYPRLNVSTDISYPIYLYHMTFVNILYIYGCRKSCWFLILVIACTMIISYVSTFYIGGWSKKKKNKLSNSGY